MWNMYAKPLWHGWSSFIKGNSKHLTVQNFLSLMIFVDCEFFCMKLKLHEQWRIFGLTQSWFEVARLGDILIAAKKIMFANLNVSVYFVSAFHMYSSIHLQTPILAYPTWITKDCSPFRMYVLGIKIWLLIV